VVLFQDTKCRKYTVNVRWMTDMYLMYSKVSLLNTGTRLNPSYTSRHCSCNIPCTLSSSSQLRLLSSFFLGDAETEILLLIVFFVWYLSHLWHMPHMWYIYHMWHMPHTCNVPHMCGIPIPVTYSHMCDMSPISYPYLFKSVAFLCEENKLRNPLLHVFIDIYYFIIVWGFILRSFHFILKICLFPLDSK